MTNAQRSWLCSLIALPLHFTDFLYLVVDADGAYQKRSVGEIQEIQVASVRMVHI